jgi:restriction system protein
MADEARQEVPDFQSLMRPLLEALTDGVLRAPDLRDRVATALKLDDAALEAMLPSGRVTLFANRLAWANVYLQRAGCVERPNRGVYALTDRGRRLLAEEAGRIDMRTLQRFPEYLAWSDRSGRKVAEPSAETVESGTPEEELETIIRGLDSNLQHELLERIKSMHPRDFEGLVLKLLAALGYGGGKAEFVKETPYVADGGVDGIINEDALGLDTVYVQAKRYTEQNVGRPEVQAFVGTLVGLNAHKGVFVTTTGFAASAVEYARRIDKRVILIDGERLTRLMVDYGVGVRVKSTHVVKEIDENLFE